MQYLTVSKSNARPNSDNCMLTCDNQVQTVNNDRKK